MFSFYPHNAGDLEKLAYFYGPVGALLGINLLLFASTTRQLTCGLWKRDKVKSTTERLVERFTLPGGAARCAVSLARSIDRLVNYECAVLQLNESRDKLMKF